MDNQEKGILYERQVNQFIINNTKYNSYLWNECPENILIENKLISSHNHNRIIRKDIKEHKKRVENKNKDEISKALSIIKYYRDSENWKKSTKKEKEELKEIITYLEQNKIEFDTLPEYIVNYMNKKKLFK